jgi:hypothetical protein
MDFSDIPDRASLRRSLATPSSFKEVCLMSIFLKEPKARARSPLSDEEVLITLINVDTISGINCMILSLAAARIAPRQETVALRNISDATMRLRMGVVLFLSGVLIDAKLTDFQEQGGNCVEERLPVSSFEDIEKTSSQASPEHSPQWRRGQGQEVEEGLDERLLMDRHLVRRRIDEKGLTVGDPFEESRRLFLLR